MAKEQIEESLNGIATMLIMWDGVDAIGLETMLALIEEVKTFSVEPEFSRLRDGAAWLHSNSGKLSGSELATILNDFVSASLALLNGSTSAKFPGEDGPSNAAASSAEGVEFGSNYDPEFVSDFIERHSLAMQDLEESIIEFRLQNQHTQNQDTEEQQEAFALYVKKYLHNVKGDAGSIGLVGVEKGTHAIEDILQSTPAYAFLDGLLEYREWVKQIIEVLLGKRDTVETYSTLLQRIEHVGGDASVTVAAPAAPQPTIVTPTAAVVTAPTPTASKPEAEALKSYVITADLDIFSEFKAEASDHLGNIEEIILSRPDNLSTTDIGTIFRCVHSLKGASSYFNLEEINKTSHILENLLDEVRDGKRELDAPLKALVFRYIDLQKTLLDEAQVGVTTTSELRWGIDSMTYLDELKAYAEGRPAGVKAPVAEKAVEKPVVPATPAPQIEVVTEVVPMATAVVDPVTTVAPSASIKAPPPAPKENSGEGINVKTFVKVDTNRLDGLIDSIGEMVVYSSMLIRSCRELLGDNEAVLKTSHQVEKFSRELQDIGMSMRLDPVKSLFQKMSRLVWDVSKKLGKEVNFVMRGEDTEVDRTVIEKLADPLMHMVRNALDHGVEPPAEREAKGKPRAGTVELSAQHSGGSIHIEIKDDGRGLNPEKLIKKAIEKGVISPNAVLTNEEAFALIFAPGFSTAAAVTDISGRGVGMDVVRNNIESMRGAVRIDSEVDKGSVFRIELPLTLAIMDGIETIVGDERFIIPTLAVLEFIKPESQMITHTVGRGETFYFRGNYLPLFRLADLFDIESGAKDPGSGLVIVVESGVEQVALLVDGMVGTCQTVIKGLGKMFDEARGFAGCAIMPNGNIGLIVDVRSLLQLARHRYEPKTLASRTFSSHETEATLH